MNSNIPFFKNSFLTLFIFTLVFAGRIQAQVGINILIPDSSAALQVESDERGFLPPRLTSIQRDQIDNPADGLMIFNTEDSLIQYFNGECWLDVFRKNCTDCDFDMTLSNLSDTIDRVLNDSVISEIQITQTNTHH